MKVYTDDTERIITGAYHGSQAIARVRVGSQIIKSFVFDPAIEVLGCILDIDASKWSYDINGSDSFYTSTNYWNSTIAANTYPLIGVSGLGVSGAYIKYSHNTDPMYNGKRNILLGNTGSIPYSSNYQRNNYSTTNLNHCFLYNVDETWRFSGVIPTLNFSTLPTDVTLVCIGYNYNDGIYGAQSIFTIFQETSPGSGSYSGVVNYAPSTINEDITLSYGVTEFASVSNGGVINCNIGSSFQSSGFCQALLYNRILTTQEKTDIETSLKNKWGF